MKLMIGTFALALLAATPAANAQRNAQYCVRGASGQLDCSYQTLAQCQSANSGGQCIPNPNFGTTGSGSMPREGIPPQDGGPAR
jgi:hypothetical protein